MTQKRVDAASATLSRSVRCGPVRVRDHSLVDDKGPFLGLGVSYFTALWRCKYDRSRLEADLDFLSRQGFNYYRMLSMVGYHTAWRGRESAPVTFVNRQHERVDGWTDYWQQLRQLIDLAHDPLTGEVLATGTKRSGEQLTLPAGPGARLILGRSVPPEEVP